MVGLCSIVFLVTLIGLHSTKLDDDRLIMSMAVNEFFSCKCQQFSMTIHETGVVLWSAVCDCDNS